MLIDRERKRMARNYCKAYYLKDLRAFPGWSEERQENEPELTDESVVYLWDDFTVVRSPVIPDKGILFEKVTPEWQAFCHTSLQFEIPEDLRFAYEQNEQEQSVDTASRTE
jgi:hypothetical protein